MGFGTKYTTAAWGSFVEPTEPEISYPRDCWKLIIIDIRIFKATDPLLQKTSYIGVGAASVECCCAPLHEVEWNNPPVNMEDIYNCCITGSIEEGNLRYLYVSIEGCCWQCARGTEQEAANERDFHPLIEVTFCPCNLKGTGSTSFRFNTTPGLAERDLHREAEKAFMKLGDCDGCLLSEK